MESSPRSGRNGVSERAQVAKADAKFWGRVPHLRPNEIAALAIGKDPIAMQNLEKSGDVSSCDDFSAYVAIKFLVDRAIETTDLSPPIRPNQMIEWMDSLFIEVPADFRNVVESIYPVRDYRALCRALFAKANADDEKIMQLRDQMKKLIEEREEDVREFSEWSDGVLDTMDELHDTLFTLQEQIQLLEAEASTESPTPEFANDNNEATNTILLSDLDPRAVTSLQKIIVGLAIAFRGYSPLSESNERSTSKELEGVLAEVGLNLNWKTIEKVLVEAKVRLSEQGLLKPWK